MTKGSGTRSGLLWEVERILNECKELDSLPQVLLMENVPDVIGTKNYEDFMKWCAALENMGYQSYYKVLNAKDYGIPQNRERCFMVSILGCYNYTFPKPIPLKLRLKDMLEESVDDKYYISNKLLACLTDTKDRNGFVRGERFKPHDIEDEYAFSITTNAGNRPTDNFIKVVGKTRSGGQKSLILDSSGICSSLTATDYKQPKQIVDKVIPIKENTKQGYALATEGDSINLEQPNSKTRRGRVGKQVAQTLTTSCNQGVLGNGIRIRKLTPKECWRLMGFTDEDFEKAQKVNSNTQLYKQAGNSIVKQVLMAIFKQMID